MSGGRRSVLVLALGLGLTALGHLGLAAPTPLFDGVFVEDPYRFVKPPPGAPGDPQPVEQTEQTANGSAPFLAVGTSKGPPQAQVIAKPDSVVIPPGTTTITVSIRPSAPTDPVVAG